MTRSTLHKKKIIPLAVVLTLVILGIFNLNSVYALEWEGDGATFLPEDPDELTQYGVFIPQPNMYTTMSIDASNQGRFAMMNWRGEEKDSELVTYPGEDISYLYPWDFNNYVKETPTKNNFTNPWLIDWMNVTAYNPHDVSLSSYTLNSVFDYHVMIEGESLLIPVRSGFPVQIDIPINRIGPKILKFDWLSDDPNMNPLDDLTLVSPSGKVLNTNNRDIGIVQSQVLLWGPYTLFRYISFVAHEKGTYRLLIKADYPIPMYLKLEFLNTEITTLRLDTLIYGGHDDETPTTQDLVEYEWQNKWYRINGEKGDMYRLDFGLDFHDGIFPATNIWMPCENGYIRAPLGLNNDIYFPITGTAYISFIDELYGWWYRYSLYLSEIETITYGIGNTTIVKVDRDEEKAIEFEVEQDSFVRFNYTLFDQPLGDPTIYADTAFSFLFDDSKKLECYDIIYPLDSKTILEETFYYYYMPAGTYRALIANQDIAYDGVVEISSKYVDFLNDTIPISSLTYPDIDPSQFLTIGFQPDAYYPGLHEAQCVDIDITEPGQYVLNATIFASDNLGATATTTSPYYVIGYNASAPVGYQYIDYTAEALSLDGNAFKAVYETNPQPIDHFYIAHPSRWHDMHFNLTQAGTFGIVSPYVWTGSTWDLMDVSLDETDVGGWNLADNGSIVLNIYGDSGGDFWTWQRGVGGTFDLPDIDEDLYYWLDFACTNDYLTTRPFIDYIQLSNISIQGDLNLVLVGESGYEYCNFWTPYIDPSLDDLFINQEVGYENDSRETFLFTTAPAFPWDNPAILGLEEGTYKLLIIPYGFGYQGSINIDFGISNFWSYRNQVSYNIIEEPNLYPYQINSYNYTWYGPNNITMFSYGLTDIMNFTEMSTTSDFNGAGYFVVECFGEAYQWTQLVVAAENVSEYDLYIMQDLPWVNNSGPNREVVQILDNTLNTTVEFGALSDHFYLIFEFYATFGDDMSQFMLDLTQYNTTILTTSIPIASYSPPSPGLSGPLVWGLVIGIPVAAGIIVVIYVLKKKGRIGSKTP